MNDDTGRLLYEDAQLQIFLRDAPVAAVLVGEVDATNSGALVRVLTQSRHAGDRLVVDTGALRFVDVSGIRALVMPGLPAEERWIRLRNVTPFQRRLLEITGWLHDEAHPQPLG